ncbi:MAG: hypothetical protein PHP82_01695 [Candidatus ainarchaeum sp.]|nr:hypothetical protein [Candidatus ainarchaeum sp.]
MVQIVLSLSKEKEKELRQLAMEKYDGKKGSLSKIVEEGIDLVKSKKDKGEADKDFWEMVNNAKDLGKIKFDRQEANYRRIFP